MVKFIHRIIAFLLPVSLMLTTISLGDVYPKVYFETRDVNYRNNNILYETGLLKYGCKYETTIKVDSDNNAAFRAVWLNIKKEGNKVRWSVIGPNSTFFTSNPWMDPADWDLNNGLTLQENSESNTYTNGWLGKFYIDEFTGQSNDSQFSLKFVDNHGNVTGMAVDGFALSLGSTRYHGTGISSTYGVYAYPCKVDTDKPVVTNKSWAQGLKISGTSGFKFITYDYSGSNMVSYWFSGNATDSLNNYKPVLTNKVDNQEGVNSGSIKVVLTCSTCEGEGWGSSKQITLQGVQDMNITNWAGNSSINKLTWNSKIRGYNVIFTGPAYEIEKPVTVKIEVKDNPVCDVNSKVSSHSNCTTVNTYTEGGITFNNIDYPEIGLTGKSYSEISPRSTNEIKLALSDLWAGINTGTLNLWISYTYTGYTGEDDNLQEIELTGGYQVTVASGTFVKYKGEEYKGGSGSYYFSFYPEGDFPENATITITGYVLDKAGNTGYLTSNNEITTRKPCSAYGCQEIFTIKGIFDDLIQFSGSRLNITGTRLESPYPYLTGDDNEILMCGLTWTGLDFNLEGTGNLITGNSENYNENGRYDAEILNITGVDFSIEKDENSGRIKIKVD